MFPKSKNSILKLIAAVVICEAVGISGAFFTTPAIPTWYQGLEKPALTPPAWIFGPVWTLLFFCMGISLYLVWDDKKAKRKGKMETISIFCIQLVLNLYWSILFFGLKNPGAAFFQIIILWISILATIIVFSFISKYAAYLLIPYLLWVSFATYLNWGIWQNIEHPKQITVCTEEAKICPDGSSVGRTGPNCTFALCEAGNTQSKPDYQANLPTGYTTSTYTIEKTLDSSCQDDLECTTPPEYLLISRCPMTSICLENKCTVICPNHE